MKTIYLSGPMSGHPDHNHPAFHAEADRLRAHGYQVINPAEINVEGGAWHDCLRADIRALMDCDTIALLPGWEASQGAHLELHIAHRVGMRVVVSASIEADIDWCCENGCGICTPKLGEHAYSQLFSPTGELVSQKTEKVWYSSCCGAELMAWRKSTQAFDDSVLPTTPEEPRRSNKKLSDTQVRNIRRRFECGNASQRELADEHDVHPSTIRDICNYTLRASV